MTSSWVKKPGHPTNYRSSATTKVTSLCGCTASGAHSHCHDSSFAQNYDLIGSFFSTIATHSFTRFGFWAHEPPVAWIPGIPFRDVALHWRHNYHGGVSNHQPHDCLLNRIFSPTLKKTSKLRVTGLCAGNSPAPVNSPHKGPVTRKMLPFDDVIMEEVCVCVCVCVCVGGGGGGGGGHSFIEGGR